MTTTTEQTGTASGQQAGNYRWYVLFVLTVVFAFSHMDRNIVAILLPKIQEDLGLTYTEAGAVSGLAFGVTYIALGIPIARLADRFNRTKIIAICLAVWSGMTALCGAAYSFTTMFLARMGVGIGEAGGVPPSQSIIADYFPRGRRALAFSIFGLGIPIGTLLGFGVGGTISDLYSWRVAFVAVGLPGILIAAVLIFTVREPKRGLSETSHALGSENTPSFFEVVKFLASRKSSLQMTIASSLIVFGGYGSQTWIPSFFVRSHGLTEGQVGIWLGPAFVAAGAGAVYLGGLADRLGARDERWYMWIPAIAIIVAMPVSGLILLMPAVTYDIFGYEVGSFVFAIALMSIPGAAYSCYIGPVNAMLQQMVGLRMRATTVAIFLLITNLVGLGLGPILVGVVTDVFEEYFGGEALRYAMLSFVFIYAWSTVHFLIASKHIRADLQQASKGTVADTFG